MRDNFQYLFGPVFSWRLGVSVGIDLLSADKKICNFNCAYCQLGETEEYQQERRVFVPTEEVISEVARFPCAHFDYYTFSSSGEPTLAKNLGDVARHLKKQPNRKKIAVITNSSLMHRSDVQEDLLLADFVLAKLDACGSESLQKVNSPSGDISFDAIVSGIKSFRKKYTGRLALQIMFIKENQEKAQKIAEISRAINPDEIQINTPLRPCSSKPLSEQELEKIKNIFTLLKIPCKTVYEAQKQEIKPINIENTQKRHGKVGFSEENTMH